jgi:hypothetical protein
MGGMERIARFSDKKLYNAQPCLLRPAVTTQHTKEMEHG